MGRSKDNAKGKLTAKILFKNKSLRRSLWIMVIALIVLILSLIAKSILLPAYDIVVYGGGFAGCAAARNAAAAAPGEKVLLIVPDVSERLGGLGTVGGQNFADIRRWQGQLVTAGSFGRWFGESGQFYNTIAMAETIAQDLAQFKNLTIIYSQDICGVKLVKSQIKEVSLKAIYRDRDGLVKWGDGENKVTGQIFIDASDDGKLAALSGANLLVGREDWPAAYLTEEEKNNTPLQQAATLMFKVTNIITPEQPMLVGDLEFVKDDKGSWGLVGGKNTWKNDSIVRKYNQEHSPQGFAIKPINAAQDGAGSKEWWVNMLLVFNVDGRQTARDQEMGINPPDTPRNSINVDQAWTMAREILNQPEFLEALRQFRVESDQGELGFASSELVKDNSGLPVVGEIMYLRETVHSLGQVSSEAKGQENTAYALTTLEAQKAGNSSTTGDDSANYQDRIGLGYYLMDINAYTAKDLLKEGQYSWPVTDHLRPDWREQGGQPVNPVYLPYSMLINQQVPNLLIPGYAASCSSMAWAEIRVLPNLTVLGDAAGVAAARAVLNDELPAEFGPPQIKWLQTKLTQFGARLDK